MNVKKIVVVFLLSVFAVFLAHAQEAEYDSPAPPRGSADTGLHLSGGVRTGLLIRHRDFGGRLGLIALSPDEKIPMTLYFASYENHARIGEAWINLGYSWDVEDVGRFGLRIGLWAHGGTAGSFQDTVHLGDRFVWANFFEDRFRFIGGQGGGSPISSGGWIGANWLSYTGLRFFWVDPSGFSAGLIFPDPARLVFNPIRGEYDWVEGISPVDYLSMLGVGLAFRQENFWISLQFDNSPIYDDTEANFSGGLRRPADQRPIAQAGNLALGIGMANLFGGRGFVTLEAMVNNMGEDHVDGLGEYTISPVTYTFALQARMRIIDTFYAELRTRYTTRQGDPSGDPLAATQAVQWGRFELEPHVRFRPFDHLRFDLSANWTFFFNSYYLALNVPRLPYAGGFAFDAGWAPGHTNLLGFLSTSKTTIRPRVVLSLSGVDVAFGYTGVFSRDHVNNTMFVDLTWTF